jgi:hypothetical protein
LEDARGDSEAGSDRILVVHGVFSNWFDEFDEFAVLMFLFLFCSVRVVLDDWGVLDDWVF